MPSHIPSYQAIFENELHSESPSIIHIVDSIIQCGYELEASDIHLDPSEQGLQARIRIYGTLQSIYVFPSEIHQEIVSRLKILAGLRIDEHSTPHDGRFRILVSQQPRTYCDVRVSIAPTQHGENAILRLLLSDQLPSLDSLGLNQVQQKILEEASSRTHGLILITGPTGSGKTTTLYALLRLFNSGELSVITIEDPIEFPLEGATQIEANKHAGLSFAEGLRTILRQDPDIIGVGEIRDNETAALAVHAALTGHLVLSTIHATTAVGVIPRLIDLGIEPYLLAATLTLVVNERLVPRLCKICRALQNDTANISRTCEACNDLGIDGRMGIFEVMLMTDQLCELIAAKAPLHELRRYVRDDGVPSLFEDGVEKARRGLVSMKDILSFAHD